jgi:hypothetical protein
MKTSLTLRSLALAISTFASSAQAGGAGPSPLERLPSWHLCQRAVDSTRRVALEKTRKRLANVRPDSWKRGLTADEKAAMVEVSRARAIDAVLEVQEACRLSGPGPFQSACKASERDLRGVASHDWRQPIPRNQLEATKRVLDAKSIDFAGTVLIACRSTKGGAFADACKTKHERLTTIAKKDWQRDQIGGDDETELKAVMTALYVDIAQQLRRNASGGASKPDSGVYLVARRHIDAVATKQWSKDEITGEETAALCSVLATSARP